MPASAFERGQRSIPTPCALELPSAVLRGHFADANQFPPCFDGVAEFGQQQELVMAKLSELGRAGAIGIEMEVLILRLERLRPGVGRVKL